MPPVRVRRAATAKRHPAAAGAANFPSRHGLDGPLGRPRGYLGGRASSRPEIYLVVMRLLIVRHGLAGKADAGTWPDDDLRPLTPKGLRAFARAAEGLRRACPETAEVLASPALRTLQTAWILAKALGMKRKEVVPFPALHHASSPRATLKALSRRAPAGDFAVVGHEPNLGELASLLVSGSPRGAALPLGKGAACLIEIDGGIDGAIDGQAVGDAHGPAPGSGRLLWSMTQDQLAALGRAPARR